MLSPACVTNVAPNNIATVMTRRATDMVSRILDHPHINVSLSTRFVRAQTSDFAHVFYSVSLDGYLDHEFGPLGYRTLDFERFTYDGDYQGGAVMN